jgi:DNA repair exonuclease SbcCD ATPase subunit
LVKETSNYDSEIENLKSIKSKIDSIEKIKSIVNVEELNQALVLINETNIKIKDKKHEIEKTKLVLDSKTRSISKLTGIPCGEQFPTCKFIKDSLEDKKTINEQKIIIESLQEAIQDLESNIEDYEEDSIKEKLRKYESAIKLEMKLRSDIQVCESKIALLKHKLESLTKDIEDSKTKKNVLDLKISAYEKDGTKQKRARLLELESEVSNLMAKTIDTQKKQAVIEERLLRLSEDKEKFTSLKEKWFIHSTLSNAYGRKGIPMTILSNELPRINDEISRILQPTAGYTVKLVDDENDLDILLDYGDNARPIELGSGM